MKVHGFGLSAALLAVALPACKGGSSAVSAPTPPSASATCSPPVVTTCFVSSGQSAETRAAIGQVTVMAGGAPSCRVAINEGIPISFTIVNPRSTASWTIETNTRQAASPSTGSAATAGPFQATVQFRTFGGDNITDDTIHVSTSDQLGCEFHIYGHK